MTNLSVNTCPFKDIIINYQLLNKIENELQDFNLRSNVLRLTKRKFSFSDNHK